MKWTTRILSLLLTIGLVAACGDSRNSARAIIHGQEYEMKVQGVDCWAGPPGGAGTPGYPGVADTPLVCSMNFRSGGAISDYMMLHVSSVTSVYRDFMGAWVPVQPGLVWAELTFGGVPETVYQGQVRFDNISNYAGDDVCAAYEFQTGNGLLEGYFCGRVREGYM